MQRLYKKSDGQSIQIIAVKLKIDTENETICSFLFCFLLYNHDRDHSMYVFQFFLVAEMYAPVCSTSVFSSLYWATLYWGSILFFFVYRYIMKSSSYRGKTKCTKIVFAHRAGFVFFAHSHSVRFDCEETSHKLFIFISME